MDNQAFRPSTLDDPRERAIHQKLLKQIESGNKWAPGHLQFRRVQIERGLNHEQIENAVRSIFAEIF